jgi:uncharacterized membrane protein HdeD (DUF308 family)
VRPAGADYDTAHNQPEAEMGTPVLDELAHAYRRTWWALVLRGVLALVVGIFTLVRPLESIAAFALLLALWAIFGGVVEIVHAIDLKPVLKHWWVILLSGLVSAGFGIAALYYYPGLSLSFAVVWFALWLMSSGVLGLYVAVQQRSLGIQWGWSAVFGVVNVVASVFALISPPATLATIMGLIAAFAIVTGVVLIGAAVRLHSATKPVRKLRERMAG